MDAQKFGAFIAGIRREQNLTQAQLAEKIHVTDKAVSRWERGLGFPDINSLEPLADALGISILELMQSEKNPENTVTKEDASEALVNTMDMAKSQWRRMIKRCIVIMLIPFLLVCIWVFAAGFMTKTDTYLIDYTVMPQGDVMTIKVGSGSSMGYIRDLF